METFKSISHHHLASAWVEKQTGEPVVVVKREHDASGKLKKFPANTGVILAARDALVAAGRICSNKDVLLIKSSTGEWVSFNHKLGAKIGLSDLVTFVWTTHDSPNINEYHKLSNKATEADTQLQALILNETVIQQHDIPLGVAEWFAGREHRSGVPEISGFLLHPVHREELLRGKWLYANSKCMPQNLPGADPSYPHLRKLFSNYELSPHNEAALYSYLLACYHPYSIDYERPILIIDAAVGERGKSQIGRTISYLLDGVDEGIPFQHNRRSATDTMVAYLIQGRRVLTSHNLDDIVNYQNEYVIGLSTDGISAERGKYSRFTTPFQGICIILNGVYGRFTLHIDMITRCTRVELEGPAKRLDFISPDYAKDHRFELAAEALLAHERATEYTEPTRTRFSRFELVGAAAYAEVFCLEHKEVADRLKKAEKGRWALSTKVAASLLKEQPEKFSAVAKKLKTHTYTNAELEHYKGTYALGLTYDGEKWI
jgi:hypothetical protein